MLRPEKRSSREEQQFRTLESKVGKMGEKSVRLSSLLAGVIVTASIEPPVSLIVFCLYRVLSTSCGLPIMYVLPGPVPRM